jgi:hypothetical protein
LIRGSSKANQASSKASGSNKNSSNSSSKANQASSKVSGSNKSSSNSSNKASKASNNSSKFESKASSSEFRKEVTGRQVGWRASIASLCMLDLTWRAMQTCSQVWCVFVCQSVWVEGLLHRQTLYAQSDLARNAGTLADGVWCWYHHF